MGMKAIGNMEHARGHAMNRFEDVQDRIRDHRRILQPIKDQVPEVRPYMALN